MEVWLRDGDENTKVFHQFVQTRKSWNTIWEVKDGNGTIHIGHESIDRTTMSHYGNILANLREPNIWDIMMIFSKFNMLVH
jgi:hypothetical protein